MINESVTAIVLRAENYRDYDKKLKLLTENGEVMSVIIRGVKRSGAKLKFCAQPFSFCNFELGGKGIPVVTGAAAIEDLTRFDGADVYGAACVMLEAAEKVCGVQPNKEIFILLLRKIKTLLYEDFDCGLVLISFLQNVIHKSGYAYKYDPPTKEPTTVMELLACTLELAAPIVADKTLERRTFAMIESNFEDKFSCALASVKFFADTYFLS